MNYKGSYDNGTSYSVGDVTVFTDGIAYLMKLGAPAGTKPHDQRYWTRLNQPLQEVVIMLHGMLTAINASIASQATAESNISKMIAPEYTKTTYTKGDIRIHSGKLYQAKQDIGTAENWTAAHWDEITVGGKLSADDTAIASIPDNISDEAITLTANSHDYRITVDTTGEDPDLAVTLIEEET